MSDIFISMVKKTNKNEKRRIIRITLICIIITSIFIMTVLQHAVLLKPVPEQFSQVYISELPTNLEIPVCAETAGGHEIHTYEGFSLCYREMYEQAEWVAYEINRSELVKETSRTDNFRTDPAISTGSATPADYKNSGYDRGHLAPAADMAFSKQAMSESFYMSNMSPQTAGFNRGVWKDLESAIRKWAEEFDSVYIVSGPVLEKETYTTIGLNKVAVPEWYYKVIFVPSGAEKKPQMIAFLLPNQKSEQKYDSFAVSVDEVEERTGIDFFAALDDKSENILESVFDITCWQTD